MSTIHRNHAQKKNVSTPFSALSKLDHQAQMVLVLESLKNASEPSVIVPLLERAADLVQARPHRRTFLADRWTLWPRKLDELQLRIELCCFLLRHWNHAVPQVREGLERADPRVVQQALRRGATDCPGSSVDWLLAHGQQVNASLLEAFVMCEDRSASRAAGSLVLGMVISALGFIDDPLVGEHLSGLGAAAESCPKSLEETVGLIGRLTPKFDEHANRDIMIAACLLADGPGSCREGPMQGIGELMEAEHPATAGMRAALRRCDAPFMRARAWRWLGAPAVRLAALDRVSRASSVLEHEVVLRDGYLALRPVRCSALGLFKSKQHGRGQPSPVPSPEQRDLLSTQARRWLIDFGAAVKLGEEQSARLRERGLTDESPWIRWAHQRVATGTERVDYAFDSDPRVARSAALARSPAGGRCWIRWPARSADRYRLGTVDSLTRSAHSAVRAIGRGDARRMNPFLIHRAESRIAARQWLKGDRAGFIKALGCRLENGSEQECVEAIQLIRMLRLGVAFEPILIDIAEQDQSGSRASATAVAALGDLATPTAKGGVEHALQASDVRVRANAIEASVRHAAPGADLAETDPRVYRSVMELKSDLHHRVRANALRALIEGSGVSRGGRVLDPSGTGGLCDMLDDQRGMHRLAGLWLAERTMVADGRNRLVNSWDSLARRVAAMAVRDVEDYVRTRALRCAKRLLAEVRVCPGQDLAIGRSLRAIDERSDHHI